MIVEERLSRENCEGCATSCKLSAPSCPFGKAAATERREELEECLGMQPEGQAAPAPSVQFAG